MASVPITELKAQLAKYLRMAARGAEVQILDRGVPIARLMPMPAAADSMEAGLEQLVRAGTVRHGEGLIRSLLRRRVTASSDLLHALDEDRRDRS